MKAFALGAALFVAATAASADGYTEPYIEPPVIVEDAADGSANSAALVLAMMTLLLLGTAAATN